MAIVTTTDYADISHTEHLAEMLLEESRPKKVLVDLVNHYTLEGKASKTMKLNRWDDPGQATAGTEGTDFTTLTTIGTTAVTVTPVEGAIGQIKVTNDAAETRVPGQSSIQSILIDGTNEQKVAALAPETRMANAMVFEKIEDDISALFAGLSRSVGTTTVAFTLAQYLSALLTLETGEDLPHDDFFCALSKNQFGNLRAELMATSGGVAGTLWAGTDSPTNREGENGFKMNLLGVDVYTIGIGVTKTANTGADHVGCMGLRGIGAPEDGGGGQPGVFTVTEGRGITVGTEYSLQARACLVQVNAKYIAAERNDNFGVKIVTDAG